jgi:hypothetical protein
MPLFSLPQEEYEHPLLFNKGDSARGFQWLYQITLLFFSKNFWFQYFLHSNVPIDLSSVTLIVQTGVELTD